MRCHDLTSRRTRVGTPDLDALKFGLAVETDSAKLRLDKQLLRHLLLIPEAIASLSGRQCHTAASPGKTNSMQFQGVETTNEIPFTSRPPPGMSPYQIHLNCSMPVRTNKARLCGESQTEERTTVHSILSTEFRRLIEDRILELVRSTN
eukprot:1828113-Rhodomonas_salina.2